MPVYELEPAHKFGSVKWGVKLGRRVDGADGGIPVEDRKWFEEEQERGFEPEITVQDGSLVKKRRKKMPEHCWSFSGLFVTLKGADTLRITAWADDNAYGYVQTDLGDLTGEEINQHPVVGRKLRYTTD